MNNLEADLKQNADKQRAVYEARVGGTPTNEIDEAIRVLNEAIDDNDTATGRLQCVHIARNILKAYRAQQTPVATSEAGEALDMVARELDNYALEQRSRGDSNLSPSCIETIRQALTHEPQVKLPIDCMCEAGEALDAIHNDLIEFHNGYDGKTECRVKTIRQALTSKKWMPIESAPKDGTLVCYDKCWSEDGIALAENFGEHWQVLDRDDDTTQFTPTHWQPLPTPPNSETTEGDEG